MKKKVVILGLILFLSFPFGVSAQRGCCSRHGGVAYYDTSVGRYVCADGSYSPTCGCTYKPKTTKKTTTKRSTTTTTTATTQVITTSPNSTTSETTTILPTTTSKKVLLTITTTKKVSTKTDTEEAEGSAILGLIILRAISAYPVILYIMIKKVR